MTPLPLMLGEAPGPGGGTHDPLGNRTARRLCLLAGWEPEGDGPDPYRVTLARRFELRNVLDYNPGKVGKGMRFPLPEARRAIQAFDLEGRVVVALGKRVGSALGLSGDYFVWGEARGARVVICPHPSGTNRALNNEETRRRTGEILREVAR